MHCKPRRGYGRDSRPIEDDEVATIVFIQNAEVIPGTDGVTHERIGHMLQERAPVKRRDMCPDGTTRATTGGNVHMLQFDNIDINNDNEQATISNLLLHRTTRGSTRTFLSRQIGYCSWTVNPPPQSFKTRASYQIVQQWTKEIVYT